MDLENIILMSFNQEVFMENRVKELRVENGITQQGLADKVSVSSRTIISLEKQKYNPSVLLAYKIASVFNLSIEETFIFDEDDK